MSTLGVPEERRGIPPGVLRRALDVLVSAAALVVFALPMLIVAVLVRLESPGPSLYRQQRIGQGGRMFRIYKFRSMVAGSSGSTLTVPGDARITRLGKILRSTCIDELPQLFNILFGTMTLVGPRPQTLALAVRYPKRFGAIFDYRPGLTGPGVLYLNDDEVLMGTVADPEAHYLRSVVPARVALDLQYLENATVRRTIGLMVDTVRRAGNRLAVHAPGRPSVSPSVAVAGAFVEGLPAGMLVESSGATFVERRNQAGELDDASWSGQERRSA